MKLINGNRGDFAIPANRIDWIKWEETVGGRCLIKIGTGGMTHHFDYESISEAKSYFEAVKEILREL